MPALPEIIDENGIDLFLLTKDGITIYMAMDAPSYLQETDDDLVKWIRYYAYQKRNYTARLFKRYEQWEARIKDEFSSRGVPEEIAELCMVESGCTYEAVSPVGAVGMWQIMPETGRAYKLTINQFLDERKNPFLHYAVHLSRRKIVEYAPLQLTAIDSSFPYLYFFSEYALIWKG